MSKKKLRLRKWVRVTLNMIGGAAVAALCIYVLACAVLQTSYRLDPPSMAEIQEAQEGGLFAWVTLANY